MIPVLRLLARNLPLVLLLVMIGALFWPTGAAPELEEPEAGKDLGDPENILSISPGATISPISGATV